MTCFGIWFQSTHPRGVRHQRTASDQPGSRFQSTHPRGVRREPTSSPRCSDRCFNPRTHVGCDRSARHGVYDPDVSIHAPTWGATRFFFIIPRHQPVSIHAPTWGATAGLITGGALINVSIHAPTWGATLKFSASALSALFQSTHPRGVRRARVNDNIAGVGVSIHAPTWGATALLFHHPTASASFNPRTHVGCDVSRFPEKLCDGVSIHAPTWGATYSARICPHRIRCFNPRTHVGCDRSTSGLKAFPCRFNPRTHVGCDIKSKTTSQNLQRFQSTHPRGVRQGIAQTYNGGECFNPRTHVGCDYSLQPPEN